jgi:hypothetical protein
MKSEFRVQAFVALAQPVESILGFHRTFAQVPRGLVFQFAMMIFTHTIHAFLRHRIFIQEYIAKAKPRIVLRP